MDIEPSENKHIEYVGRHARLILEHHLHKLIVVELAVTVLK